jgi:exodeoxyribonuclease VII small subunit
MMTDTEQDKITQLPLEQALQRVEGIVRDLGNGNIDLETALACYEEGITIVRHCNDLLQKAKRKIEILRGIDESGNPVIEQKNETDFRTETR